jgi:hypothetical protein
LVIVSFNGVERIGKSYFAGLLNKHLLSEDKDVKKFSFPSYTTITGKHLARLIKQFRQDDLLFLNPHSHSRYKKIADLMIKNYEEYRFFIEGFLTSKKNSIAILNNNFFSVIAHGLAADVLYNDINKMIGDIYLKNTDTLAFFLVAKNVKDVIVAPFRAYETNYSDMITADILSIDHLNYYSMVNNYYKEIFLTYSHLPDSKIKPILLEIDLSDVGYITKTCESIKHELESYLR